MTDTGAQAPTAEPSTVPLALACPYCGSTLHVNTETVGRPYLTYEQPESIGCSAGDCDAAWEPDGTPRDAPLWQRYPNLYEMPARVAAPAAHGDRPKTQP